MFGIEYVLEKTTRPVVELFDFTVIWPESVRALVSIVRVPLVLTRRPSRVEAKTGVVEIWGGITLKVPNILKGWTLHLYVKLPAAGIFTPMVGVKVKLRNVAVELKRPEKGSFGSTALLLLRSRCQL